MILVNNFLNISYFNVIIKIILIVSSLIFTNNVISQEITLLGGLTIDGLQYTDANLNVLHESFFATTDNIDDMTYHPDGHLYVIKDTILYTFDESNGALTYIFTFPTPLNDGHYVGLSCDHNGTIFANSQRESYIESYNPYTGIHNSYGAVNIFSGGDCEFYDGNLYIIAADGQGALNQDYIIKVNLDDPTASDTVVSYDSYTSMAMINFADSCQSYRLSSLSYGGPVDIYPDFIINQSSFVGSLAATSKNSFLGSVPSMLIDSILLAGLDPCSDIATGSATAHMRPGRVDVTYSIDQINFQSSNVFNNLTNGDYQIMARDGWGCIAWSDSFNIDITPAIFNYTVDVVSATCGENNGMININSPDNLLFSLDQIVWAGDTTYTGWPDTAVNIYVQNNIGCLDTISAIVDRIRAPHLDAVIIEDALCDVSLGSVTVYAQGASLQYLIDNITTDDHLIENLSAGNYQISIIDSIGCRIDSIIEIKELTSDHQITWTAHPSSCDQANGMIILSGDVTASTIALDNRMPSSEGIFSDLPPGDYYLKITDSDGCSDVEIITISMEACAQDIFIPNVFTPNNDGLNDLWLPRGDYELNSISIFNRWGGLVFSTSDNGSLGWDGYNNGQLQSTGVYIYILEYQVIGSDNIIMDTGALSLLY